MSLRSPASRRQRSWRRWAGVVLGASVVGVGLWLIRSRAQSKEVGSSRAVQTSDVLAPTVKVVRPRVGGIPRIRSASRLAMHAFESGRSVCDDFLPSSKSQAVDIGSRIHKGEVLAEINVPRDAKAHEEAAALVTQAKAQVKQADARIKMGAGRRRGAAEAAAHGGRSRI